MNTKYLKKEFGLLFYSVVNGLKMDLTEYTPQQYRKYNGQAVMKAIESMGYQATANKIAKAIGTAIKQPEEVVLEQVKEVLKFAVANGFLVTRGKSYLLPGVAFSIQTDGRRRVARKPRKIINKKKASVGVKKSKKSKSPVKKM